MSANISTAPNPYDSYPAIYQTPTLFNPASNDLAGNRALLESNLVGGGKKRNRKSSRGGDKKNKKSKKNIKRSRRTRKRSVYFFD